MTFLRRDWLPQDNKQTEVVNQELIPSLKTKLNHIGKSWIEELSNILSSYRTTFWEGIGVTPFRLVYGGEVVALVEIRLGSILIDAYDETNMKKWLLELAIVEEA